jgi:hypothetical protein
MVLLVNEVQLVSERSALEEAIGKCNQVPARQSLETPLAKDPFLNRDFNTFDPDDKVDDIINGTYLSNSNQTPLSTTELE